MKIKHWKPFQINFYDSLTLFNIVRVFNYNEVEENWKKTNKKTNNVNTRTHTLLSISLMLKNPRVRYLVLWPHCLLNKEANFFHHLNADLLSVKTNSSSNSIYSPPSPPPPPAIITTLCCCNSKKQVKEKKKRCIRHHQQPSMLCNGLNLIQ